MRRPLGALLCLGSLTALSTPIATAHAAAAPQVACRVYAAKPHVTAAGTIQASASRLGCDDIALLRIHIKRAVAGTDPVVKSAAQRRANGRSTASLRCIPGVYYTAATDHRGNEDRSEAVQLSCTTGTPTPKPAPSAGTALKPAPSTGTALKPAPSTGTALNPTPSTALKPTPSTGTALKPASAAPGSAQWPSLKEEAEVVRLANLTRQAKGCGALTHDVQLHSVAQNHSKRMAATNTPDHENALDRIKASGFAPMSVWGENAAWGFPTPNKVVDEWMKEDNTSAQRENILNCAYTHAGAGLAYNAQKVPYWTLVFAKR
jgi:uncharacterized protein YkwD